MPAAFSSSPPASPSPLASSAVTRVFPRVSFPASSSSSLTDAASPFVVRGKTFSQQFAALYFVRLHGLRAAAVAAAERWLDGGRGGGGEEVKEEVKRCRRLLDVLPSSLCLLTGTLYKEQKLKPSILAEYSAQKKGTIAPTAEATNTRRQREEVDEEQQEGEGEGEGEGAGEEGGGERGGGADVCESASQVAHYGRWVSDDDVLILEDETGRIILQPNPHTLPSTSQPQLSQRANGEGGGGGHEERKEQDEDWDGSALSGLVVSGLCTGVVVSVLGRQDDGGRFIVDRVFIADLPPQPNTLTPSALTSSLSPSPSPPFSSPSPAAAPRYVLMVSGLSFGCPSVDPLPLQLLQDYCTGFIGQHHVNPPTPLTGLSCCRQALLLSMSH